ncbi:MAG: alpha/beta hydrolase [Clostridia bacterium]|nr:alpha/beta hydrolase [Clostridia bacterium]
MLHEKFILDERYPDCTLTTYVNDDSPELAMPPRPAIIVCPGGAYGFCSERESEPIALHYLSGGLNAFILRYSVKENAKNFAPIIEVALAIKHVRENAEKYNIDPERVFTVGFSAGGHLAASAGVFWNHPTVRAALGDCPEGINRPTGMVLSYPVITAGPKAHKGSIRRLCSSVEPTQEEKDVFSLELHVDETTPPAFLWHTYSDGSVPVENSLLMASALRAHGVPFELHIYPEGPHGLSLCNELTCSGKPRMIVPRAAGWAQLSLEWIKGFKAKEA